MSFSFSNLELINGRNANVNSKLVLHVPAQVACKCGQKRERVRTKRDDVCTKDAMLSLKEEDEEKEVDGEEE